MVMCQGENGKLEPRPISYPARNPMAATNFRVR
jgi:hypothetical protein